MCKDVMIAIHYTNDSHREVIWNQGINLVKSAVTNGKDADGNTKTEL